MGRGLSDLQKRVLDVLSDGERHLRYEISEKINGPYHWRGRVKVVSLSRAISRLHARGLIDIFTGGAGRHYPNGYFWDVSPTIRRLQITSRGLAYLRGEDLPPLDKVVHQRGTDCPYCGAELPVSTALYVHKEHKLIPPGWKVEVIG